MRKICVAFILGLMIGCIAGGDFKAYWRVLEKISNYGDNVTLICMLNEPSQTYTGSLRWYKEEKMCSLNNKTTKSCKTKYKAVVVPEGVKLTILNFDEEDFNETYHCDIGFYKSDKHILSEEMVFREKKVPVKSDQSKKDGNITIIIVPLILGLLVLGVSLCIFWKRCYIKRCWKYLHGTEEKRDSMQPLHTDDQNGKESNEDQVEMIDEVKAPLLNGQLNRNRNSSLHESEDVVQNDGMTVPPDEGMAPQLDADETSLKLNPENSQNGPTCVLQRSDIGVAPEVDQLNAENIQNRAEAVLGNDEVEAPLLNGNRNSSLNESEDVQNDEIGVAPEVNQLNAENIQNRPEVVLQNDGNTASPPVNIHENAENNLYQPPPSTRILPACTLYKGIGKHAVLAPSGSTTEVALIDSRGEQNDITDPKILHREPINRGFQYTIPDHSSTTGNPGTEPTNEDGQFTLSNTTEDPPSSAVTPEIKLEYRGYKMRISSFNKPLSFSSPSKEALAGAGFFYKGHANHAMCYVCGEKHNFKEGENPSESKFHKPNCCHSKKPKDTNR